MNVFVTGGMGFLGQSLVGMLAERGDNVVSYDLRAKESEHPNLVYIKGDIGDLPTLIETLRDHHIEKIIHTAAISHPVLSRNIPYRTMMTNAVGTINILEAARLLGIKRVVNLSSECAYGNNSELEIVHENASLNPTTPYGATKVFTEKMAYVYTTLYGMEVPSLRPGWLYGPGQFEQCYMKTLLRNAIDGVPSKEESGIDYRFQYVHVTDVARACILAMDAPELNQLVFNITGGTQISYGELVSHVQALYPDTDIEIGAGTIDILDANAPFDISRAKEVIGYEPKVQLEEGIRTYAEWLKNHEF